MEYFKITNKTNKEVGNIFPQIDFNCLDEVAKFSYNKFPSIEPNLSATLEKRAKLTDVLSQASILGHGVLINEEVKKICESYNLMKNLVYDCPVKNKRGKIFEYYWLSFSEPELIEFIDFTNSEFVITKGGFPKEKVYFSSYKDYLKKRQELPSVVWSFSAISIKLLKGMPKYDFFVFPALYVKPLISEDLKSELVKKKITGLEFTLAPIS